MGRVVAISNQKGGTGKTSSSINIAVGLASAGRRVLLIDMDPQANTTYAMLKHEVPELTVYDLLIDGHKTLRQVMISTRVPRLDLLPSSIDLAGAEAELLPEMDGRTRLRDKLLEAAPLPHDYIVIDCPPSLGLLTINALAASSQVYVPVSASIFALQGLAQLENTIIKVRKAFRVELEISGIIATLFDNTNTARDAVTMLSERFGAQIFQTIIPKNVKIEEAHSRGLSVIEYAPSSRGAAAYLALVEEILERG